MDFIEILGYIATALVAGSFLMRDVIKLRALNASGAVLFVIYGLIQQTYPVALLNAFLVVVNVFYILKDRKAKQESGAQQ